MRFPFPCPNLRAWERGYLVLLTHIYACMHACMDAGFDYKLLMSGSVDQDPLLLLTPALSSNNVHLVAKLASKIPCAGGTALTPGMVFCAFALKQFWKGRRRSSKEPAEHVNCCRSCCCWIWICWLIADVAVCCCAGVDVVVGYVGYVAGVAVVVGYVAGVAVVYQWSCCLLPLRDTLFVAVFVVVVVGGAVVVFLLCYCCCLLPLLKHRIHLTRMICNIRWIGWNAMNRAWSTWICCQRWNCNILCPAQYSLKNLYRYIIFPDNMYPVWRAAWLAKLNWVV